MKKILILMTGIMAIAASSFGGYGWYNSDTYITIDDGGGNDTYSGSAFDGLTSLGTFDTSQGDTLTLNGFKNYNWEDGGDNVMDGWSGYQVKVDGTGDGSYTTVNNTTFNDEGGNNESWASSGLNINLLSTLGNGTYELSFYSGANVDWNVTDGSADTQIYSSNGGNNYRATFQVIPEPATVGLFVIAGGIALAFRRLRTWC